MQQRKSLLLKTLLSADDGLMGICGIFDTPQIAFNNLIGPILAAGGEYGVANVCIVDLHTLTYLVSSVQS